MSRPRTVARLLTGFLATAEESIADEARRPAAPLEPRWGWSNCPVFIGWTPGTPGSRADAEALVRLAQMMNANDPLAREELEEPKP